MCYYRRRLPHWIPDASILFITWRLAGSLPAPRADLLMPQPGAPVPFVQQDERLARSASGPFWLRDPRVASMLQQALRYGETPHNLYFLHAWVILPNHVHVILEPRLALPGKIYTRAFIFQTTRPQRQKSSAEPRSPDSD